MTDQQEPNANPDKLVIKGIEGLDGEYPCNVGEMAYEGLPSSLTNREGHRVKVMSGVRAGELWESLVAGDNDVLIAFAAVILTRRGKRFDESVLWDAPMGTAVSFDIAKLPKAEESGEEDPPMPAASGQPESNGGDSGKPSSDVPESDLSPTGSPPSDTSATSAPVRLAS